MDSARQVIILSPHLDDAVYSCWHALSPASTVINFFAGVPPTGTTTFWDRVTGSGDSAERMRARRREDAEALGGTGSHRICLDLLDGQYPRAQLTAGTLQRALPRLDLDGALVLAPAAIGGHTDHRLVRDVGLELARAGATVEFYAEIPYAIHYGWPSWVDGGEPVACLDVGAYWGKFLDELTARAGHLLPQVVTMSAADARAKVKAMRMYRTQYPALLGNALGAARHRDTFRYEVTWRREA